MVELLVQPGTNLTVGKWYRITVSESDPSPSLKTGDVVQCQPETAGCIDPESRTDDGMGVNWFADYVDLNDESFQTLVSGAAEVTLKVWHDGNDWIIAESAAAACDLANKMYGSEEAEVDDFNALADDCVIGVICEDGKPSDQGVGVKKTAAEWAAQEGRGVLCSRDF